MSARVLVTGACGFVGSSLARALRAADSSFQINGIDNLIRPGSELNRAALKAAGVRLFHGDVRSASDFESLPECEVVIDAAANASVLAGVDGKMNSRQLTEHNLSGTINILEYCKRHRSRFILLSTSRVYSVKPLAELPVSPQAEAFVPVLRDVSLPGLSERGIAESFSSSAPVSLYGATKLASEVMALEYGSTFGFPVFVNRCGVMAGAGQFGRPDQGIFAFWINSHLRKRPLKYIGFGGSGYQVRDCLHPDDLAALTLQQIRSNGVSEADRLLNVSGGVSSATSLRQLTAWCDRRFGTHTVMSDLAPRPFDLPWVVLDSSRSHAVWKWRPLRSCESIFSEIADHALKHPEWLDLSSPGD